MMCQLLLLPFFNALAQHSPLIHISWPSLPFLMNRRMSTGGARRWRRWAPIWMLKAIVSVGLMDEPALDIVVSMNEHDIKTYWTTRKKIKIHILVRHSDILLGLETFINNIKKWTTDSLSPFCFLYHWHAGCKQPKNQLSAINLNGTCQRNVVPVWTAAYCFSSAWLIFQIDLVTGMFWTMVYVAQQPVQ